MITTDEFLEELINEELILAVLSGCRKKDAPDRVRIRPVELKGEILYQASASLGTKMFHRNCARKQRNTGFVNMTPQIQCMGTT